VLKDYIGYDYNNDGNGDTDIFKRNSIEPSFYCADDFSESVGGTDGEFIRNNVQTRRNRYAHYPSGMRNQDTVSFW
jgi:hypothetical protein